VSFDSAAKNAAFKKADNFQFELWSDLGRELAMYYDAASSKTQSAADRVTVVLDETGKEVLTYSSWMTNTGLTHHPKDVLADCKALKGL
jgi:peroxiredoxin